jgi:hypothetical protein
MKWVTQEDWEALDRYDDGLDWRVSVASLAARMRPPGNPILTRAEEEEKVSHYDDGLEIRQVKGGSPQDKQAGVKRLLKRLLMAATEESGKRRIVGLFAVTFTAEGGAGLAYALTTDEVVVAAEAVPAGLERALKVVRVAAEKPEQA